MKLTFGDPESLRLKKEFELQNILQYYEKKLSGVVKCPGCKGIKKIVSKVDVRSDKIVWQGCFNKGCSENCAKPAWDCTTNLNGGSIILRIEK